MGIAISDPALRQWKEELQADHPDRTNEEVRIAYRTANPRDPLFSQESAEEYRNGQNDNSVDINLELKKQEFNRNRDIINLREHIVQELLSSKIVTETEHGISTINPGILKILEIKHIENSNEPSKDTDPRPDTEDKETDSRTPIERQIEGLNEALEELEKKPE